MGCPRREGSVVLEYDALFAAERVQAPGLGALLNAALGSGGARPGLAVGTAPVLRNVALGECGACAGLCDHRALPWPPGSGARPGLVAGWAQAWPRLSARRGGGGTAGPPSLQSGRWTPALCSSPAGPASPAWPGRTGMPPAPPSATATTARTTASAPTPGTASPSASECRWDQPWGDGCCPRRWLTPPPRRRCPVGSDFWFMGLRCDYRVTQQSLLGMAAGVLLSIVLLGAVVAAVAIRRFKALLLEARADQTRSRWGARGRGGGTWGWGPGWP